jgi:hypothetical protein
VIAKEVRSLLTPSIDDFMDRQGVSQNSLSQGSASSVEVATGTATIEITINRDFDTYDSNEQTKLLSAIAKILEITGDVRVVAKSRGSVKLALEVTHEQAERLLWAVRAGELAEFGVVDADVVDRASVEAKRGRDTSTEKSSLPSPNRPGDRTAAREVSATKPPPSVAKSAVPLRSHVRFIGTRELHRDLPKVLDSLEDPGARFVLTIHSKPKAVIIGAEAFLDLLRGASPEDRLLALQLGALVQGLEAMSDKEMSNEMNEGLQIKTV